MYKLKPTEEDITKKAVFTKNAAGQITGFNFSSRILAKSQSGLNTPAELTQFSQKELNGQHSIQEATKFPKERTLTEDKLV